MVERDPLFMLNATRDDYDHYCRLELEKLTHIHFLAVDVDLLYIDEGLDGNIKLVMEKS